MCRAFWVLFLKSMEYMDKYPLVTFLSIPMVTYKQWDYLSDPQVMIQTYTLPVLWEYEKLF